MAAPRVRYAGGTTFVLPGGNEIYVTNKYVIPSGPEAWLGPIGLSSLRTAMKQAGNDDTNSLYVGSDLPDRFDSRSRWMRRGWRRSSG